MPPFHAFSLTASLSCGGRRALIFASYALLAMPAANAETLSVAEYRAQLQEIVQANPGRTLDGPMDAVIRKVDREDPQAQANLGAALLSVKHYVAAADVLARATQLDPTNVLAQSSLGHASYQLSQCAVAIPAFKAALSLSPKNASAHHWWRFIGDCQLSQSRPAEALLSCTEAVELRQPDPGSKGLRCLGKARYRLGQYNQALAAFRTAGAKSGVAASLARLGDTEMAMAELRLHSGDPGQLTRLLAYAQAELDDAKQNWKQ